MGFVKQFLCVKSGFNNFSTKIVNGMTEILSNPNYNQAHKFGSWYNWIKKALGSVWNALAAHYKWPQVSVWDMMRNTLMEVMGLTEAEAKEMANDLSKLVY